MKTIAIIGGGNLGRAIAEGLLQSHYVKAEQLIITRNRIEKLQDLAEKGVTTIKDNTAAVRQADIIIIAVKPFKVHAVLKEVKTAIRPTEQMLISVATGISIQDMKMTLDAEMPIVRAMPNTAIAIQESITCIAHQYLDTLQIKEVETLFNNLGQSVFIQEELMEAATVLGACGIAYVLRFIRAMIQGGIEIGFDANTATTIATQTVKGAAQLLIEGKQHPEAEIDKVTTPKGCTISGLNEMEHRGFSSSLIKGILNSYQKIEK